MEASEHVFVGNSIQWKAPDGTKRLAATAALDVLSGALTYGYIVALGGDFYGTSSKTPISSSGDRVAAFGDAFQTLENADTGERAQIIAVIDDEIAHVADAIKNQQEPSTAFDQLGDSLSGKWNSITYHGALPIPDELVALVIGPYGRYMDLATVNLDHFGADAWTAYAAGHSAALDRAKTLHGKDPSAHATLSQLRQAYAMNAFADHFLTDMFASGHSRTPRRALSDRSDTIASETGYLSKAMHDEDNKGGVLYVNRTDPTDTWVGYGDGHVRDKENSTNLQKAITAVQRSADDVYDAYVNGTYDEKHAAVLELVPIVAGLDGKTPEAGPTIRTAPLFWTDSGGEVHRRDKLTDPSSFVYSADANWSDAAMVAEIFTDNYLGIDKSSPPVPG